MAVTTVDASGIKFDPDGTIVFEAFATAYGYQSKLDDGTDNPESKQDFFTRKVEEYIINLTKGVRVDKAVEDTKLAKKTADEGAIKGSKLKPE